MTLIFAVIIVKYLLFQELFIYDSAGKELFCEQVQKFVSDMKIKILSKALIILIISKSKFIHKKLLVLVHFKNVLFLKVTDRRLMSMIRRC